MYRKTKPHLKEDTEKFIIKFKDEEKMKIIEKAESFYIEL